MVTRLNPYLNFAGRTREAMEFYASVLGGEPEVMTYGAMGEEGDLKDQVMHSALITPDGYAIFAADIPPGMETPGNGQVSISGDERDKLRGFWEGLSDGATVTMPLERQVWGDDYGSLVDKFGVAWMVNIAGEGTQGG